ncbi:MAG: alpha/beta hydrolase [Devosia sp.]|nr:alpha/beta hydrolase [Devosia sp.]
MFRTIMVAAMLLAVTPAIAQNGARVEVNGIEMYYEVSGDGPPLIVLHGAYMNIATMGQIMPDLAESNTVYALELQGHGRSTDIDRPINYENLASDIVGFMDAVGIEKASLFGYSMGASTALRLAIDHPERVERAVLASVA